MSKSRRLGLQSIWDSEAVLEAFATHGIKPGHAIRLWSHLVRHPSSHWSYLPDLPKAAKAMLDEKFTKFTTRVVRCVTSSDGETTKLLIALQDGQQVEAVIMHYDTRATFADASQEAQEEIPEGTEGDAHLHDNNQDFHSCDEESSDEEPVVTDGGGSQGPGSRSEPAADTDVPATTQASASDLPGGAATVHDMAAEDTNNNSNVAAGAGEPGADDTAGVDNNSIVEGVTGASPANGTSAGTPSQLSRQGSSALQSTVDGNEGRRRRRRQGRGHGGAGTEDDGIVVFGTKRSTLCVSSQVGCQMGCTFCATGTMGLKGNLTAGEIVEQLVHANAVTRVRNIVFMGMGEPLANYEPVRAAIRLMTSGQAFALRRHHVTLSTVGVIPRIKQLATDLPGISLALSLHAPTQALRSTIVPSARAYPLEKLMQAVRQYQIDSGQRVFMEYVMLAGVNDGAAEAHALGALLTGHNATLNLIPWNPVIAAASSKDKAPAPMAFTAPAMADVQAFQAILKGQYGIPTTVRQEKGQDIGGACGQLVIQQQQDQQPQQDQQKQQQQPAAVSKAVEQQEPCCGQSGGCESSGVKTKPPAVAKQASGLKDIEELR